MVRTKKLMDEMKVVVQLVSLHIFFCEEVKKDIERRKDKKTKGEKG